MECNVNISLDWLSFSFFQDENHYETDKEAIERAYQKLLEGVGEGPDTFFKQQRWEAAAGRKPYSTSRRTTDGGIAIFANAKLPHALVEISGKGCARLLASEYSEDILQVACDRATRIDVACDIECDLDPIDFAAQRAPGRFKSGSQIVSESGTTVYVGSKTSNRYARVYRYAPPHPRSHLLRVEHVFKGEDAKTALSHLGWNGYESTAAECAKMFGWQHPLWDVAPVTESEMKADRPERGEAKTIYWLYETVAPVLARLHKEGKLPIGQFLNEAVMPLIPPDGNE